MGQNLRSSAINIKKSKSINLAGNLQELMKSRQINITRMSRDLNIPMMTIRRLLSGETGDPRISTLKLIADYFTVSLADLIEGKIQNSFTAFQKSKPYLVPILSWETATQINNINELDLGNWKQWQPITVHENCVIGKKAFALESKPSMHPRFPQGTVFIIDPDISHSDGDIVLVRIKKTHELTLRELTIDSPEWKLNPVVPGTSNVLQLNNKDHEIVGVVLLTLFYNRRISA